MLSERLVMMGLSGVVAGRSMRAADATVAPTSWTAAAGSAAARMTARRTAEGKRRAMPSWRRRSWPKASPKRSRRLRTWTTGAAGRGRGGPGGTRSRSKRTIPIFTAPTPSVMEWWIFMTTAAVSSVRPSMTVISHSGRSRSNPCMAMGPAACMTWTTSWEPAALVQRRW